MAVAGGIHVHCARTSNRGRIEESVGKKGICLRKGVVTQSGESLVRRLDGLIYVQLTRAEPHATAFLGRSLPPISISPPDNTDGL